MISGFRFPARPLSVLRARQNPAWLAALAGAALAASAGAQVQPSAGMLRWPAISKDSIAFSYANDLWLVPRTGGTATPFASPPGQESFPRFSPDGKTLAFVGNYDGNRDLYTMPVSGGIPNRVTHHPTGETLAGWTPDSKLLFIAGGMSAMPRQPQMFTVTPEGGLPQQVPVPYAGFGSISPDGTWLAYTTHSTDNRTWKRYRGGMATDVWLFNLKDKSSRRATNWEGTDTIPMWIPGGDGSAVYFLSDRGPEHRLNIWSYSVATGESRQVTKYADDDVRWPSVGPGDRGQGEIIFQLGAELRVLDLATATDRVVTVTIPGDRPKIRQRAVKPADTLGRAMISPSGKRVVISARGDLYSVPAKEGVTRALTTSDGVNEIMPVWSPDGKWIAYLSDESGEYELWVRAADTKPPEKKDDEKKGDTKKDEAAKDEAKIDQPQKDESKKDEAKPEPKPEPKPQPRKLTTLRDGYRFNPVWTPDSKKIGMTDQNGRIFVVDLDSGKTTEIDKDPGMDQQPLSFSSDSRWLAYARADEGNRQTAIWIADLKEGGKQRVTDPMFSSTWPTFDRKGDFLFFASNRAINGPTYSDIDTSFVYTNTDTIHMVPLRKDVKNPWLPKSDEEIEKPAKDKKDDKDKKKPDEKEDKKADDAKDNADKPADKPEEKKPDAAPVDDGISGTWSGSVKGVPGTADGIPITITVKRGSGDTIEGSITSAMGGGQFTGTYKAASGEISLNITVGNQTITLVGTVKDAKVSGTWSGGNASGDWSAERTSKGGSSEDDKKDGTSTSKDEAKPFTIDFEGFERRAIALPIVPGSFTGLAVAEGEKLVFRRNSGRGNDPASGIKVYGYAADEKKEELVTATGDAELSPDGKQLLVRAGNTISIVDASAGGKSQAVSLADVRATINPRDEWNQIFTDAWRITRDFFYEPTLHGVDWPKLGKHYRAMLDDATSREDVNWIISEMISELNIGHAYLGSPGDVEEPVPSVGVGLLGADYELVKTDAGAAYRVKAIYDGAPWDTDARAPLSQPGVDVKTGDFILAVNGAPIDTSRDPWAAFLGTADRITSITVSSEPVLNGKEREIVIKPVGSEGTLRYRAWIERNRAYVAEQSKGSIGYIYVPNTGVDGQSDLFRQFYGQRDKAALIIDERWNGGGQIPTRFIELLNRPRTNYWARRDGADWNWPPDSHQGPKAMLINGLAGSGGDMFPWLFKFNNLGPLIGTRTWGGLVGISGNPGFIDGGSITVPTFGFYKKDGNWGVEGHGVDPDIEVLDDPAKMQNGGDPQLDKAIEVLLAEVAKNPYTPPKRPASPDRKGMGIPTEQR